MSEGPIHKLHSQRRNGEKSNGEGFREGSREFKRIPTIQKIVEQAAENREFKRVPTNQKITKNSEESTTGSRVNRFSKSTAYSKEFRRAQNRQDSTENAAEYR